jgi:hypothetical protein
MSDWTVTEIEHGRFKTTNGDIEISVFADFSGQVVNEAGDFIEFADLRTFIEAGEILKQALVDHYGDYK